MADQEQLKILGQGVQIWNNWRSENPTVSVDLTQANLIGANLIKVNFLEADLSQANLDGAQIIKAILTRANLRWAKLRGADLSGAGLSGASLIGANLSGANLSRANLTGANLTGVGLNKANLTKANLVKANVSRGNLVGTNLAGANLGGANLLEANLYQADLSNANLRHVDLVETKLEGATLVACSVYGVSVWNVDLTDTIQKDLIITREKDPVVMVDDLEVAQFVHLLLHHDKLRNVLKAVTERGVLLLGRFSNGGIDRLKAVGERLRGLGYTPIIFDFDRPTGHDYTETVKTLVGLSRFVIVELSGPSVPYELASTVFGFERPFSLILEKGKEPFFMSRDLVKYPWVLQPIIEFEGDDDLLHLLPDRIVSPAEAYITKRQERLA